MSTARPTVSVVIPCYNAEAFVEGAVASACGQSYPLAEVICVNDGSTDGTLGVLQRLHAREGDRLVVLSQPNRGPSAARNTGLARATGEYVQFLDADDILQSDKIEHQAHLVRESDPPPDLVAAAYEKVALGGVERSVTRPDPEPLVGLFLARLGITSANLYRREALLAAGGWDEAMRTSEDPELAFRMFQRGAAVCIDPTPKTLLRRRADSQWNEDWQASLRGWLRLRMAMLEWAQAHDVLSSEQQRVVEHKVFEVISQVYTFDPELAVWSSEALSKAFRPQREKYGRTYAWSYQMLGFRAAQGIRAYGSRIRAAQRRMMGRALRE